MPIPCRRIEGKEKLKRASMAALVVCVLVTLLLLWYYGPLGVFAGTGWTLAVVLAQNYDKVLQTSSYLLASLSRISKWSERRAVVNFLQGTINITAGKINSESEALLPHDVRVEIVKPTDRETFLRQGEVVVCLESSRSQDRNLARATLFYVAEDLVRDSRRFIDQMVMRACDFAIARKMLMSDHRMDALKCLNDEFLNPETDSDPGLRQYVLAMDEMDSHGTLTRILLREFSDLGIRLSPKLSDRQTENETKTFTDKLTLLARKQPGIDVDPTHEGQVIRVAIMPIARAEVESIGPHMKYAQRCFSRNIPVLYVVARGHVNVAMAKMVVAQIESRKTYKKIRDWSFTTTIRGEAMPSYTARCVVVSEELQRTSDNLTGPLKQELNAQALAESKTALSLSQ